MSPFKIRSLGACLSALLYAGICGAAPKTGAVIDPDEVLGDGQTVDERKSEETLAPASLCIRAYTEKHRLFGVVPIEHEYWDPCYGDERLDLEPERFFELVEQPNLFRKYQNRRRTKVILFVSSLGVLVGGAVVGAIGIASENVPLAATGLGVGFGGFIVLSSVEAGLRPHPTRASEAAQLAREYDLKRHGSAERLPERGAFIGELGVHGRRMTPVASNGPLWLPLVTGAF